jgi:hypothetical protein
MSWSPTGSSSSPRPGRGLSEISILALLRWSHAQTQAPDHAAPAALASPPAPVLFGLPAEGWRPLAAARPPVGQVVLVRADACPTAVLAAYWDGQDWLHPTQTPVWLVPVTAWRPLEPDATADTTTLTPGDPDV